MTARQPEVPNLICVIYFPSAVLARRACSTLECVAHKPVSLTRAACGCLGPTKEKMTEKRIVLCSAGSQDEAQKIARTLVERHLAACVNIVGPVSSTYWWRGQLQSAE